jgi:hypothetical protein
MYINKFDSYVHHGFGWQYEFNWNEPGIDIRRC